MSVITSPESEVNPSTAEPQLKRAHHLLARAPKLPPLPPQARIPMAVMGFAHQGTVDLDDPANEPTIKWVGRPVVSNTYYIKAGDNYFVLAETKHWPKTLGKFRAAPDTPGLETVVLTSAIEYEYETCAPPIILEPAPYAAPARALVLNQRTAAPRRALPRRAPRAA